MLIYVAGPYSASSEYTVAQNIEEAKQISARLWEKGHAVICPHMNTAFFENEANVSYQQYMDGDFMMVRRCDAMVMTPRWRDSKGAKMEHEYARSLGIPIYYWPDAPDLHLTEVRCPEQAVAFSELVGKMYRVHLDKNADYSPANILLTGNVGAAVRIWDKTARILNLLGFDLKVNVGTFSGARSPKNESLLDAFMDLAVYAIIGWLLLIDKWGK